MSSNFSGRMIVALVGQAIIRWCFCSSSCFHATMKSNFNSLSSSITKFYIVNLLFKLVFFLLVVKAILHHHLYTKTHQLQITILLKFSTYLGLMFVITLCCKKLSHCCSTTMTTITNLIIEHMFSYSSHMSNTSCSNS